MILWHPDSNPKDRNLHPARDIGSISDNSLLSKRVILCDGSAKFGLLHVRDGKDEDPDRVPKKNKKRWFKKIDKRGNLRASVRYTKNLGFQFKCFADYREINFDRLKEMLEKNKYRNVSKGEGKVKNRAYFIHYGHPTCKSIEGFENNYFYPE